jgi:ribonuclease P protein component
MANYQFNRESRLLTPDHFQKVFNKAVRFNSQHITLLLSANDKKSRIGFAIAKKRIKLAVQRNRIKRIVRNSYRLNQHQLPNVDMIIMAKTGIEKLENKTIQHQIESIWQKIIRRSFG